MRISDFSELTYQYGGSFSSPGPWLHQKRVIDTYELILMLKGEAYLQEGVHRYSLKPNDYLLLHPGIPHEGWKRSLSPVAFYWLHFYAGSPGFLASELQGTLKDPGGVLQSARQLLHLAAAPAYPAGTATHMLYVLLAELLVDREQQTPSNALAAQLHEHIRSHAREPLTVQGVAAAFGYHPDHLSRVLKSCYGFTLRQDIIEERLNLAKILLQTTRDPVSKIGLDLGFADSNLFEKFFCYHQHCSPTAYRKSFAAVHTNHH